MRVGARSGGIRFWRGAGSEGRGGERGRGRAAGGLFFSLTSLCFGAPPIRPRAADGCASNIVLVKGPPPRRRTGTGRRSRPLPRDLPVAQITCPCTFQKQRSYLREIALAIKHNDAGVAAMTRMFSAQMEQTTQRRHDPSAVHLRLSRGAARCHERSAHHAPAYVPGHASALARVCVYAPSSVRARALRTPRSRPPVRASARVRYRPRAIGWLTTAAV